jgi:hypothetical protein
MSPMIKQLVKLELDNIFRKHDYWGSEDQIENEMIILNETRIEMKHNESIEEYYLRIYDSL